MSTRGTILVADDDAAIRTVLNQALSRAGHEVRVTSNASTLWRWVAAGEGDIVITDVVMPDENAFDMLPRIKKARPELPVVVMSAQNTFMTAIRASETGAYEYLPKPFDLTELLNIVARAMAEPRRPKADVRPDDQPETMPLVGRSAAMQDIYRMLARMMQTDLTVMISGESGTGKELVARALHEYGRRRGGPFVAINMAAIPRDLIESELFGHEKGAFTGAVARHIGKFEQAEGGTLFLDEIGDMPMQAQTRLLRALQSGTIRRVGGREEVRIDARIIAATNRDLMPMITAGQFREDLFYRLNVVPINLPPLRERADDIEALARHFLTLAASEGLPRRQLAPDAVDVLARQSWRGNVRELRNFMYRLALLAREDVVDAAALTPLLASSTRAEDEVVPTVSTDMETSVCHWLSTHNPVAGTIYDTALAAFERPLFEQVLRMTGGNQLRAAQMLGINRNTLRKRLGELGVDAELMNRRS